MVAASCRLIDSAVRHHSRLEAAAVSRIAVNTSAETARRMPTVSVLEDGGCGRSSALGGVTTFMLAPPSPRGVEVHTPGQRRLLRRPGRSDHPRGVWVATAIGATS